MAGTLSDASILGGSRRTILTLLAIAAVGLGMRLYAVGVYEHQLAADEVGYHTLAVNLLQGNPYSRDAHAPYRPEYQRTPGYPAFVAAIYWVAGTDPHAVYIVQSILGALVIPLIWSIGVRVNLSRRAAYLVAILAAFNPMLLSASGMLLREAITAVMLTTAALLVLMAWKSRLWWQWLLAGVTFGISALIRPEALALSFAAPVAYAFYSLRGKATWADVGRTMLLVVGPVVVCITPWVLYYHSAFGHWALNRDTQIGICQRAVTLYRDADSTTTFGRAVKEHQVDVVGSDPAYVCFTLANRMQSRHGWRFVESANEIGAMGMEFVKRYPLRWIQVSAAEAINFSSGYAELSPYVGQSRQDAFVQLRYGGLRGNKDYGTLLVFLFSRFGVGFLVLSGVAIAAVRWARSADCGLVLPLMFAAVSIPTSLLGLYAVRVRIPMDPLMVTCAVAGWGFLLSKWNTRRGTKQVCGTSPAT